MSCNSDVFEPIPKSNAKQRTILVEWLNSLLPNANLAPSASDEDLRSFLADGTVLCQLLSRLKPGSVAEYGGPFQSSEWKSENVKRFLTAMDNMGLPTFQSSDLQKGSMKIVIECLLTLRSHFVSHSGDFHHSDSNNMCDGGPRWKLLGDCFRGGNIPHKDESTRVHSLSQRRSMISETSMHHVGHKFHDVFQMKSGRYADLPASKISQMMKSNGLDNAPTQSLLSLVTGILDENVERKHGEIPHRVAMLLRKVVQEIERRIATQAEHLKTQNNLFKAREEKFQSRIQVLEALANGRSEEREIATNQQPHTKEKKKAEEQDAAKAIREKDDRNQEIAALKRELEAARKMQGRVISGNDDHSQEIAALKQALEAAKKIQGRTISGKDDHNKEIAALNQELEAAKKKQGRAIRGKDDHNQEIAALKQELEAAKKKQGRVMSGKDDHNQEIAALKQELEAAKKMQGQAINGKDDHNKEIAALKQELEEARKMLGRVISEKDDYNQEITSLKQELEEARKMQGRVSSEKNDHNPEIAALKQELEEARKRQGRVSSEKNDHNQEIASLKQELEEARKMQGRVSSEKNDHNQEIASLKQELEEARKMQGRVSSEKNDHNQDIAALKQELEEARKMQGRVISEKNVHYQEISALKQELEAARKMQGQVISEKDDHSQEIAALKQELETTRKLKEQVISERDDLSQEIAALKKELETTQKLKEQLISEKDDHSQVIAALKQELETTRKLKEQVISESDDHSQEIAALKQELEEARKTHEQTCLQMETENKAAQQLLQERLNEVERLLTASRSRVKGLEASSEQQLKSWNKKEHIYQIFTEFQLGALRELRFTSQSIKQEVVKAQKGSSEEFNSLGTRIKTLQHAAENYHTVLAENQKLHNELQELKGNIRVYCRIRPFFPGQKEKQSIVEYVGDNGELVVVNPAKPGKEGRRSFKFNKVYGPSSTQVEVFTDTQPLIQSVLDGYNVCIFAYGQTGSGKTYTMTGPDRATEEEWGVNYRALNNLFRISLGREGTFSYDISVQMVEIYNEQVRDLLSSDGVQKKLGILSSSQSSKGMAVPDACVFPVKATADVMHLMDIGMKNRAKSSTAMNERSSRSHSILSIHCRGVDQKTGSVLQSSLHLVDLAGSERIDRSEVTGDRLKEAQHINKSLSALGDVISALAQKSSHIPYRNSKLTQVLQTSLGGQAKTLMFVQLNPEANSFSESMSTLKFAERAAGVELGAAKSSKDGRDVRELMEQVASLKDTIAKKDEEIERLQLHMHSGTGAADSLRYGSSPSGRKKAASDDENSECSDSQSVDSFQQHSDDFRYQTGSPQQSRSAGGEIETDGSMDSGHIPEGSKRSEITDKRRTAPRSPRTPERTPTQRSPRTPDITPRDSPRVSTGIRKSSSAANLSPKPPTPRR